jgi:hypothetical protein
MSASTPAPKNAEPAAPASSAPARDGPRFYLLSLAGHLAALASILLYLALRPAAPDTPPDPSVTRDQLEKAAKTVRTVQQDQLRQRLQTLAEIEKELAALADSKRDEHAALADTLAPAAPASALAAQQLALARQTEALAALELALPPLPDPARDDDTAPLHPRALDPAKYSQISAADAQDLADSQLGLAGPAYTEARAAQLAAHQAQLAANHAHADAHASLGALYHATRSLREPTRTVGRETVSHQRAPTDTTRERLAAARNALAEATTAAQTARATAASALASALAAQQTARAAQLAARDRLLAGPAASSSAPATPADFAAPPPSDPPAADARPAALYAAALALEQRATASSRDIRAAQFGMIRRLPFDKARALTDLPAPRRDSVDLGLLAASPADAAALAVYRRELLKARRELDSMIALGRQLLGDARRLRADSATGLPLGPSDAHAPPSVLHARALEAVAAETTGMRAADLADLMRLGDSGGVGDELGPGLAAALPALQPVPAAEFPRGSLSRLHAGRQLSAEGVAADWLFLDTWRVLGPFPNPDRRNIDRQFPPETALDLDAAYPGKNGRLLRWRFLQAPAPPLLIDEPYAIYYAYTEVRSDAPRDVWLAIGSDDNARVWVNGYLVWKSAYALKSWRVNEGYRRVHLRAGLNRILFRVENGHGTGAFSVLVHLRPPAPAPAPPQAP